MRKAGPSAARQTYEAILHRRRDPLLIEQPREREIAARIAPIFAAETKEVELEYTSEVGPERPIVVAAARAARGRASRGLDHLDLWVTNDHGDRAALATIATASDGYGPEAVDAPSFDEPVHVQVALHHRGMGGDVLGVVHLIERNARGEITIEPRPFEMMTENSTLDLGPY